MKIIKILVLIAVIFFSFHLHAMAGQDEDASPTQHCVLVCHSCCLSTAPAHMEMLPLAPKASQSSFSVSNFSYQNPSLDTSKRPPVLSA